MESDFVHCVPFDVSGLREVAAGLHGERRRPGHLPGQGSGPWRRVHLRWAFMRASSMGLQKTKAGQRTTAGRTKREDAVNDSLRKGKSRDKTTPRQIHNHPKTPSNDFSRLCKQNQCESITVLQRYTSKPQLASERERPILAIQPQPVKRIAMWL